MRTDERMTETPQVLGSIAVDVAHIFIAKVELIGIGDVYGEVVELVGNEVEVHGRGGADGPHGDGLTLLAIGESEAVVYPSRGKILAGGLEVLFGYLNGLQGIKDFFHMIPCERQKDGDSPRLAAYVHCQPGSNHGCLRLRRPGSNPKGQVGRRLPSWHTIGA